METFSALLNICALYGMYALNASAVLIPMLFQQTPEAHFANMV